MTYQLTATDLKALKQADFIVFRVTNCKYQEFSWVGDSYLECNIENHNDPWNRAQVYKIPCGFSLRATDWNQGHEPMANKYHITQSIACLLNAWPSLGDSQWTTIARTLKVGDQLKMIFDVQVFQDDTIRNSLRLTSLRTSTKKIQKSEWLIDADRRPLSDSRLMMVPFVRTEYAIAI